MHKPKEAVVHPTFSLSYFFPQPPEYTNWMSCKREVLDAKVTIVKTTSSSFKAVSRIHAEFRVLL